MHEQQIRTVSIGEIDRPVPPVREHFDEKEMAGLIESIRENGILVPLMVVERNNRLEVVDGDRRLNAAWQAGVKQIPVVVHALTDEQVHIQRMLANMDRHDPDPVSEAKYCARLIHAKTFTVETLSKKLNRSQAWVEDRLVIAEMPEYMQVGLSEQSMSLGVCLQLNQILDERTKRSYFTEALRNGMTVHAAEYNRLMVNETISSLRAQGEEVNEETVPVQVVEQKVPCQLTDRMVPISRTRMYRIDADAFNRFKAALEETTS